MDTLNNNVASVSQGKRSFHIAGQLNSRTYSSTQGEARVIYRDTKLNSISPVVITC